MRKTAFTEEQVAYALRQAESGTPVTEICRKLGISEQTFYRYRSRRPEQAPLRRRIREIAAVRVRYGYRRIHTLLRREGWRINHKRVYRLYRFEGPSLRLKAHKETGERAASGRRAATSAQ